MEDVGLCGGVAYYRDALVGWNFIAVPVNDGDTWDVVLEVPTSPTPTIRIFPRITYFEHYGDQVFCFVVDNGSPPVCNASSFDVTFFSRAQCQQPGNWTFSIYERGNFVGSRGFLLKERIPKNDVSLQDQNTNVRYDTACFKFSSAFGQKVPADCFLATGDPDPLAFPFSTNEKGCALFSAAETASSHRAFKVGSEVNLDPSYFGKHGVVRWGRFAETSGGLLEFQGRRQYTTTAALSDLVCKYGPIIAEITHGSTVHYAPVIGRTDNGADWLLADPAGGVERSRGDPVWSPPLGQIQTLRVFRGMGNQIIVPPSAVASGIFDLFVYSPAHALLIAPNGQRAGFDPRTGASFAEIAGSTYSASQLDMHGAAGPDDGLDSTKLLEVVDFASDDYTLLVIGADSGEYSLEGVVMDRAGSTRSSQVTASEAIAAGEVHRYKITLGGTGSLALSRTSETAFAAFSIRRDRVTATSYSFNIDYELGVGSDGINPPLEPVTIAFDEVDETGHPISSERLS